MGCCWVGVWRKPGIKKVSVTDRVHISVITFWAFFGDLTPPNFYPPTQKPVKTSLFGLFFNPPRFLTPPDFEPPVYIYIYITCFLEGGRFGQIWSELPRPVFPGFGSKIAKNGFCKVPSVAIYQADNSRYIRTGFLDPFWPFFGHFGHFLVILVIFDGPGQKSKGGSNRQKNAQKVMTKMWTLSVTNTFLMPGLRHTPTQQHVERYSDFLAESENRLSSTRSFCLS